MAIGLRPLGLVKEMLNKCGLEITYAYDDLVFVEHSLFIVRFNDETPSLIELFFNKDCEEKNKKEILDKLKKESKGTDISPNYRGTFKLEEDKKNENLKITFLEEKSL